MVIFFYSVLSICNNDVITLHLVIKLLDDSYPKINNMFPNILNDIFIYYTYDVINYYAADNYSCYTVRIDIYTPS